MTAYDIKDCDCHVCGQVRQARQGAKRMCVCCGEKKRVAYVSDYQRAWCHACCKQAYVSCTVRKAHGKHDNAACPDCQDVAYVDRDEDIWLPVPENEGTYAMNSIVDHYSEDGVWLAGTTLEGIEESYPPLRKMRFIIAEDADIHELMETT